MRVCNFTTPKPNKPNHTMMNAFTTAITDAAQRELADVVQRLAKHYGFNFMDAMRMLGDDVSPVKHATPVKLVQEPTPEPVKEPTPEPVKEPTPEPVKEPTPEPVKKEVPKKKKEASKKKEVPKKKEVSKYEKPQFVLPWTGKVVETWCKGLRPNKDLLSQCNQKPKTDGFCATCFKQYQTDGKTKCGTVEDRLAAEAEGRVYKNPETGKVPANYGVVLKKIKRTREEAEAEAAKFGIVIPDAQFEVPSAKKGRPPSTKPKTKGEDMINEMIAKAVAAVSSTDESGSEPENDDGMPPLETVVEKVPSPVLEVKPATPEPVETEPAPTTTESAIADYDAETEDEEEEINVERFEHEGVKYLRDVAHNILYDEKTQDAVGVWDPETKTIKECDPESSDEEEDEE